MCIYLYTLPSNYLLILGSFILFVFLDQDFGNASLFNSFNVFHYSGFGLSGEKGGVVDARLLHPIAVKATGQEISG